MRGVLIELNPAEMRLAAYVGRCRHQAARARGVENKHVGGSSTEDQVAIDIAAMGAEIAVCKVLNVYPDLEITTGSNASSAIDAMASNGATIDVKHTFRASGRLLAVPWKRNLAGRPDWYVLVVGQPPLYRIVGSMSAAELLVDSRKGNLGRGVSYIAEQSDLLDIEALIGGAA